MPLGLTRHQNEDHDHFITFSCYDRRPYLSTAASRDLFEQSLERTRKRYRFDILAYVIMPEHAHLLVTEPETEPLSKRYKLSNSQSVNSRLSVPSGTIAITTSTSSPTANGSRRSNTSTATQ